MGRAMFSRAWMTEDEKISLLSAFKSSIAKSEAERYENKQVSGSNELNGALVSRRGRHARIITSLASPRDERRLPSHFLVA